jgi:hypothetical protein
MVRENPTPTPIFERSLRRSPHRALALAAAAAALAAGAGGCDGGPADPIPGQTDFESEDVSGGSLGGRQNAGAVPGAGVTADAAGRSVPPPSGRTAAVEEADIYRVDQNRLFYLNTYRGFVIYDVADPQRPQRVSRLPVYGYPVEMFVAGNTVYALLRDALYVTQSHGEVQFQRHNVSQLVAIDVSDITRPRVLETVDIVGELREGVSRKIENTIYVVSYVPQQYNWGWSYNAAAGTQKEQAWVYSFNVANPQDLRLVQELKVFEGGSIQDSDPVTGGYVSRTFSGVSISATSNALMVVENWYISAWTPGTSSPSDPYVCGSSIGDQRSVVSVVDVSDPRGAIRLHTRFQTRGQLTDQFKQTYVYDDAAGTGTYFGIFARQAWSSTDCSGQSFIQNNLEAWDVTNGAVPRRTDTLAFGKPEETVRGTAFDVSRKVAYAITARNIDPLYVLDISDRANLGIRSQIDGLSGDMTLFRLVEGNQYLIGIGRDTSESCTGLQGTETRRGAGVAVSLMDVRNLDGIQLMQRRCVAVDNADWVSSDVTSNLDQAHKMIGMHSDGTTNVITVPVSYYTRSTENEWWWYQWKTAVGIMTWDVSAYDAARPAAEQEVLHNYGTFIHPNGEVRRSIVFTHQGQTARRMMINLSDTHISIADLQDLASPTLQSVVELAPYVGQIHRFGDYVVETVQDAPYAWYGSQEGRTEFRVKRAGAELDDTAPVARFYASQVRTVIQHGSKLVVFRMEQPSTVSTTAPQPPPATQVLVFDLADPTKPRLAGTTRASGFLQPYYPFFCGVGYRGGYWYGQGNAGWTATSDAIVFLMHDWDSATSQSIPKLVTIQLADPARPAITEARLPARGAQSYLVDIVPDDGDPAGFYLVRQDSTGTRVQSGATIYTSRFFAERWSPRAGGWQGEGAVNLPGTLVRTWKTSGGERAFLTSDHVVYTVTDAQGNPSWRFDTRLNLLRGVQKAGRQAAELRAWHRFADQWVNDLVIDGEALFVNASPGYAYWGYPVGIGGDATVTAPTLEQISNRLVAFDLGQLGLRRVYEAATGTVGVQFMGTYNHQLFANLPGDGILAIDVRDPARPTGRQFLRTLGWATHLVFAGDDAYVASGYFGTYRMSLADAPALALTK